MDSVCLPLAGQPRMDLGDPDGLPSFRPRPQDASPIAEITPPQSASETETRATRREFGVPWACWRFEVFPTDLA